jgi:DNA polymerase III subunit epsilon
MSNRVSNLIQRMLNRGPGANLEMEAWNRRYVRESNEQQRILGSPLRKLSIAAIDSETTGFHPEAGDEMISLAAVRWQEKLDQETFHTYLQIEGKIPPQITALTGIKDEDLQYASPFQEAIPRFFSYIGNHVLIGYHIGHDIHFLNYYLWRKFRTRLNHRTFDMKMVLCLIDPKYQTFSLQEACDDFEIEPVSFHTAIGDATAVACLWEKSVIQLEKLGITTLGQLYIHLSKISGKNPN